MPYAPRYGVGEAEVPFLATYGGVEFFGYIDNVCALVDGAYSPLTGGADHLCVIDYKTSSDPDQYAPESLEDDSGAIIYAWGAFYAGASAVTCKWIYVKSSGSPTVKVVETVMDRDKVMARMADIAAECQQGQVWFDQKADPNTLPKNLNYCEKFSLCPFFDLCERPVPKKMPLKMRKDLNVNDFNKQLDEVTGPTANASPAPAAPPPLPSKKMPPPLPPKKAPPALPTINKVDPVEDVASKFDGEKPVVEKGYVNAPEGYSEAAESPEHAVIIQDIQPPPEAVEVEDEFTGLELHQLKAEAVVRGLTFSPRARTKSMLELLRADAASKAVQTEDAPEEPAHSAEPPVGSLAFEPEDGVSEVLVYKIPADPALDKATFTVTPGEGPMVDSRLFPSEIQSYTMDELRAANSATVKYSISLAALMEDARCLSKKLGMKISIVIDPNT